MALNTRAWGNMEEDLEANFEKNIGRGLVLIYFKNMHHFGKRVNMFYKFHFSPSLPVWGEIFC